MSPRTDARAAILDAAEDLIAARGFDATSTAAVAAAADVPKALVFYYFPTKPDILTALVTERLPAVPIDDVAPLVAPGDPATSLVNLDDALTARDRHARAMQVILCREAGTHPDVRAHLRRFRTGLRDATVRILQASTVAPIRPGTLRDCADAWVAVMVAITGTRTRDREEIGAVARVVAAGMAQLG
ncbi:TetR/AcrR family transcriptional regulator [Prescottella sp. R16]|uniref:TetR/AcrR family transcriptional regulator n=1 Tax=Prescottella sp. R16 TaxID=3064529 RepID=UPI00272ED4D2|nr:TetR/AcrR family transcriptional regulator [Prescottella sp. R16]